jgi:hypothetical protein
MADKIKGAEREARIKAALRDNLKRRKAASRKTKTDAPPADKSKD